MTRSFSSSDQGATVSQLARLSSIMGLNCFVAYTPNGKFWTLGLLYPVGGSDPSVVDVLTQRQDVKTYRSLNSLYKDATFIAGSCAVNLEFVDGRLVS